MSRIKDFRLWLLSFLLMLGIAAGLIKGEAVRAAAEDSPDQDNILISEFRTRGPGGVNDEFIELFNPTNAAIVVTGWEIRISDPTGSVIATLQPFPDPTELQKGQHYLLANSGWSGGSLAVTEDAAFAVNIPDNAGIALLSSGALMVDQVGMSAAPAFVEGTPLPPISVNQDQSYERGPGNSAWNCTDSDNNTNDFHLLTPSDPQNLASPLTISCIGPDQSISFASTAPGNAKVGGVTYAPAAAATSGLPVTFTIAPASASVCSISAGYVSFNAVGTCSINADQPGNINYNAAAQVQQTFAVGKGSQVINFTTTAPASSAVGGAVYTPTAAASSGLPASITIDPVAAAVCSISAGNVTFMAAGICILVADQAGNENYDPAPRSQQSFAVGKGNQTITFTSTAPTSAQVGGATYTPVANATSGMAVLFSIDSTSASVCSLNSGVVSFYAPGTCTVNANQAGDARYNAAPQVQQSIPVNSPATATPGAPAHVVISEFRTLGPNGAEDEFVEIYNPTGAAVNISAWLLKRSSSCGTSLATLLIMPANLVLAAGQHYLMAASGSSLTNMDITYTAGMADDGGLALVNASGVIVDQVGLCSATTYVEAAALTPLEGSTNQSYERKPGGASSCYDTDNNLNDFTRISPASPLNKASSIVLCAGVLVSTPSFTPTRSLTPTPSRTPTFTPGTVVINEFLPHPRSDWNGDGLINTNDEYIELINMGTNSISLNNWILDNGAGGTGTYSITNMTLMPKQIAVFFRSTTGIPLSDGGGSVRLVKPDGRSADTQNYPVVSAAEQTWCRLPDGVGNWAFACLPTPGKINMPILSATPSPGMPGQAGAGPIQVCPLSAAPGFILAAECNSPGTEMWAEIRSGKIWLQGSGKYSNFVE